ncbi:MAG: MBL fold metallo-hydrolase [Candidatus Zixiibacteriota bacterium]|jgi:glyoxylase-like metal-dependent hydrolase (beta-lactamase superfamily II)
MLLETLQLGPIGTNCYIYSRDGERAVVIDPAAEAAEIIGHVRALGVEVAAIVNTHGHFDHIGANGPLKEAFDAPLCIGAGDAPYLGPDAEAVHRQDALILGPEAVALFQIVYVASPPPDVLLREGDEIPGMDLRVLETPGHSPGGISLAAPDVVFTGDSLVAGAIGRTDLCGGDEDLLISSIKRKLMSLPAETAVFPGHGPATTVAAEKAYNPFLT